MTTDFVHNAEVEEGAGGALLGSLPVLPHHLGIVLWDTVAPAVHMAEERVHDPSLTRVIVESLYCEGG